MHLENRDWTIAKCENKRAVSPLLPLQERFMGCSSAVGRLICSRASWLRVKCRRLLSDGEQEFKEIQVVESVLT